MQVYFGSCATLLNAFFLLIAMAVPCLGAVFYLSEDGDDDGDGSRGAPWRSIGKANAALGPGDTAVLLPGTYEGTIAPANDGGMDAPICYRSEKRHAAVLAGCGPSGPAVELREARHVAIEGFRIAPGGGNWVQADGCDHLSILDCYMEKAGRSTPLVIGASRHVRLVDNVFTKDQVGGNLCDVLGCTFVLIEGNTFTRVGHCPLRLESAQCAVVRGNCFRNPWGRNYELVASGKVLVEGNVITEAHDSAYSADSRAKNSLVDSIIRFNRAFRNWHTPLNSPSYVPVVRRVWEPFRLVDTRVYHNVIADNLGYGWELLGMNISSNVFANNIFFRNDRYGGHVQLAMTDGIAGDNRFLNNVLRGTEAGQRTVKVGDRFLTVREANEGAPMHRGYWSEFDGNVDADPAFVDAANRDFRLRAGSPCIDAGRPLTRTVRAGKGAEVPVYDARYFFDGFGIEGERGDWIAIGAGDRVARIERIAFNYYQPDVLMLDREMEWEADAPVSLPWSGEAPDIGAYECGAPVSARAMGIAEPADAEPGQEVAFRVVAPGGDVDRVSWDFQDGATAVGAEVNHAFRGAGHYGVRVRVRYEGGREDVDAAFVKVAEPVDPRAPMLEVDFEDETILKWGHLFKMYRGNRSVGHEYVSGGFGGGKCARLFAEADGSDLSCALAPGEWDIDAYPFIRFAYRIPEGAPVGLWLQAFSDGSGERVVLVGGSPSRASGPYPDTGTYALVDDDEWHDITVDVRTVREHLKGITHLRRFRFYTHRNAKAGQEFRFDAFAILPAVC